MRRICAGRTVRRPCGSGKGDPHSMSPDGQWAIAADLATNTLRLLPTGTGQPRAIPNHGMTAYPWSGSFPGDKRIVFPGTDKDGGGRSYVQDFDGGQPRPSLRKGWRVHNTVSPDGKWLAANHQDTVRLFPVDGGEPRVVPSARTDGCSDPMERGRNGDLCSKRPDAGARLCDRRRVRKTNAAARAHAERSRRRLRCPGDPPDAGRRVLRVWLHPDAAQSVSGDRVALSESRARCVSGCAVSGRSARHPEPAPADRSGYLRNHRRL